MLFVDLLETEIRSLPGTESQALSCDVLLMLISILDAARGFRSGRGDRRTRPLSAMVQRLPLDNDTVRGMKVTKRVTNLLDDIRLIWRRL